jgi:adenine-specific DNA-methyltransferase
MPILQWLGKEEALHAQESIPFRLLKQIDTVGDTPHDNLLIHGDNLEALKALLPYYAGRVKCVCIDPPYNTKSAFTHYDDNLEHAQWLSTIVPRLQVLRDLLAPDGSIWVTIDDNEAHYLKVLMDGVFGRKNFVANMIWEKNYAPKNDARWFSDSHDHILVFAKHKDTWRPNLLERTEKQKTKYINPDNDPRGLWQSGDLSVKTYSANNDYPITTPKGRVVNPPSGYCWRVNQDKYQEMLLDKRIWFGANGAGVPRIKRFLAEVKQGVTAMSIFPRDEVGDNQEAKRETVALNSEDVFDTPKPERLLQRVLHLATNEGDVVLDCCLGSGTTAAVALKMKRRFIGIEMGQHAYTHCLPRLQKVVDGEQGGISKAVNWQGGGGFTFYELAEPLMEPDGNINEAVRFNHLASRLWYQETGTHAPQCKWQNALVGVMPDGNALYLLYNGILEDTRWDGGNVLHPDLWEELKDYLPPNFDGDVLVYGTKNQCSPNFMKEHGITFKQTPYDVEGI